jgi:hypothetical protein
MLFFYRFAINLIFLISPLILLIRLVKKKRIYVDLKKNFVFFHLIKKKANLFGFMGQVLEKFKVFYQLLKYLKKKMM